MWLPASASNDTPYRTTVLTYAVQAMCDPSVSDVWKFQLLELLLPDWLLTPQQTVELLGMFDK